VGGARGFGLLLALTSLLFAVSATAQTVRDDVFITNGTVNAQALSGTTLYLGGSFSFVGPVTGSGVPVDTTTGVAVSEFPKVNGQVNTAIPDGAGGWYIGGSFSLVGGVARSNVARVLADNTVSPWDPSTNGLVRALMLVGSTVYLGGDFTTIGGQGRSRIAAVDASTGAPSPWNPNANSNVRTMVSNGIDVIVGGDFTSIGGQPRNRIAALNAFTGLATTWNPNSNSSVLTVAIAGNTVYVGGQFTNIGGLARNRIAALDATSGSATAWNPNANSQVNTLAVGPTSVFVGGQFTGVGGQARNRLAELGITSGLATGWNPNANGIVLSVALRGTTLYVGGDFISVGGQPRSRVAAIAATTGLATSWDPTAYSTVSVVALDGPNLFVGGVFNAVGGLRRNNLAAIDLVTGQPTAWNPNANGTVLALCLKQGVVYAGGAFTLVGGQIRNSLAALDTTVGTPSGWDPGTDGSVSALAVDGHAVYVGGLFNIIGTLPRSNLAAVDAGTGLVTSWDPGADDQVFAIEPSGGTIYVAGNFVTAGGQGRSFIAALDATSGLASSWNPDANGTVRTVVNACGRIYAGGFFSAIGGQARDRVAALDPATGAAMTWNPGVNGPVFGVALDGGVVYVGGVFSAAGGQARNRLVALDPVSGLASSWNPNCNGTVRALTAAGGWVYAAGTFTALGATPSGNLAVLSEDTTNPCPTIALAPPLLATGVVNTSYSQSLVATGGTAPYCYAVTEGSLPAGLTLSSSTGQISGTPTTVGVSVFSVVATDSRGCRGLRSYTLSIFATPSVSSVEANGEGICITPSQPCVSVPMVYKRGETTPLRALSVTFQIDVAKLSLCSTPAASIHPGTWLQGFPNSFFEVTDNGGGSYTVDQTLLGNPCGVTTGGQLFVMDLKSAGPDGAGTITVTSVLARDCTNAPVAVNPGTPALINILGTPIVVTPSSLPQGSVGAAYSQSLSASTGTPPFSFAVTTGALPAGLALAANGLLSGTPAQVGTFTFTVTATDSGGCGGATVCSLTVVCPTIALVPSVLPDGAIGVVYAQSISTTAGLAPFQFSITAGALPAGLTLSTAGFLSGTPTTAGSAVFTIGVTDSGGCSGSEDYVLDIFATPPVSNVAANTSGLCVSTGNPCVSVPFDYTRGETASVRGVTVDFQIDVSMLSLCTPGTPAASIHAGSWFGSHPNHQILVTDHGNGSYTVDAVLLGYPCGITTGGTLFTVDLKSVAGDGQGAITVTRVKARDCVAAAVPVTAGPQALLHIQNTPIGILPAVLPNAIAGQPYTQALTTDAGEPPFTFTVTAGTLPPGITLSSAGLLSGTSIVTGTQAFTVSVTETGGCPGGNRAYSLAVVCPAIAVVPATLPSGVVGTAYSQTLTASAATPPFSWAVTSGSLPAGLALNAATGEIAGTPTATGVGVFTATVSDTAGCHGSESYTLAVFETPPNSNVAANTAGLCLSASHPCVSVPFLFTRSESAPARGVSVTFQIDVAKLALCTPATPSASIHAGTWLAGFTNTNFQVTNLGGGRYTVDQTILGVPCGVPSGGQLFTVDLHAIGGDGSGAITVTNVTARDCDNAPIAATPGPAASIPINNSVPAPITDLAATQVSTGNGATSTIGISLTWTTGDSGSVQLYRAPFGSYPLYDALGPVSPPNPSAAPGSPWTLVTSNAASGVVDHAAPRGTWYYVALVTNNCGIVSATSNMTAGTLDYLLGDVSDGATRGNGNNRVALEDITLLGANYGIGAATMTARGVEYLDVGPTLGGSLTGRPLPDRSIDFEDLFVFTGNFETSTTVPQFAARYGKAAEESAFEEFRLDAPTLVTAGETITATLGLKGAGRMQGFSAQLGWNAGVVQPIEMRSGRFIEDQGGIMLAPRLGTIDAALLGRREPGIVGEGEIAVLTFRVLRTGEAGIRLVQIVARDAANHPIELGEIAQASRFEPPKQTILLAPSPNPTREEATLTFALSESGPASLVIYGVDGRRVRTLASGSREAGVYHVVWDGRDEKRHSVAPGVYYAQLLAGGQKFTKTMVYLR
jgi:Putative Ig domain/FlgD Ig-like domain/Domain of unknown function (DUF5122) beta-propeller